MAETIVMLNRNRICQDLATLSFFFSGHTHMHVGFEYEKGKEY